MKSRRREADASRSSAKRFAAATFFAALVLVALLPTQARVAASGPYGASYCTDTNRVFWFIHASDIHVGASGTADTDRLTWIVNTGRSVIKPLFTVVTGDLTDSTNGNIFGYPNGPYAGEWQQYRDILARARVTLDDYYDIPGNHDAYNDASFAYYKAYGFQRAAYGAAGQVAWTKVLPWGDSYHFVAVNTADNSGDGFSLSWPYGDYAGLDEGELGALEGDLATDAARNASLRFVFGHHPVTSTGDSQDTYLNYGSPRFVSDLSAAGASAYSYGHVHDNVETLFTGDTYTGAAGTGFRYRRVASLGKTTGENYSLVSVDCNGVNTATQSVGTWPLVLVTAPVNRYVGTTPNPYGYDVPAAASNPVRALVFDAGAVSQVRFRIDGGATWYPMSRTASGSSLWSGTWNASSLAAGEHSVEVQAVGTSTRSQVVKVNVTSIGPPPAADTVTIATATYTKKTRTLLVRASSSQAPSAQLTLVGYGAMAYDSGSGSYVYQKKVSQAPQQVTVTSSAGGTATAGVTVK